MDGGGGAWQIAKVFLLLVLSILYIAVIDIVRNITEIILTETLSVLGVAVNMKFYYYISTLLAYSPLIFMITVIVATIISLIRREITGTRY